MSTLQISSDDDTSVDADIRKMLVMTCNIAIELITNHFANRLSKQPKHTSSYKGWMWVKDILNGHADLCKDVFRMEKHVFNQLCLVLQTNYGLVSSHNMDAEEMLGIFLWILGHGSVNRNTQSRFGRSGETLSRRFRNVLDAILLLSMDIIKPIDSEFRNVHPKIVNDVRYFPFFKDCIGALDGTHVKCIVPSTSSARFIGRKGYATQNILAICDWDMCFTYVWAGWEGTAHDSRIFNEARTNARVHFPHPPTGKFYLVDSGYPMPVGFIAPYRRERYHIPDFRRDRGFQNANELFNYFHSSLRCTIERSFGVWKNRFRLLQNMTSYPFEVQRNIVVASMAIHNFIRKHTNTDKVFEEYEYNEEILQSEAEANETMSTDEDFMTQTSPQMVILRDSIRDALVLHHNEF